MPPKAGSKTKRNAYASVNPSDVVQCAGITSKGLQCGVTNVTDVAAADPLRSGGKYCAFHGAQAPASSSSGAVSKGAVQCSGNTSKGTRCGVTSALDVKAADPLKKGELYCTFHKSQATTGTAAAALSASSSSSTTTTTTSVTTTTTTENNHMMIAAGAATAVTPSSPPLAKVVQCQGLTGKGVRCRLTNTTQTEAADPLRNGSTYCSHHSPPSSSQNSGAVVCKGITAKGVPCGVSSTTQVKAADPLRAGGKYCSFHKAQETKK